MEWGHPGGIFSSHGKRMKQFTEILVRHSGAGNEKGGPAPAGTTPSDRTHCPARPIRGSPPPCFARRKSRFHRAAPQKEPGTPYRERVSIGQAPSSASKRAAFPSLDGDRGCGRFNAPGLPTIEAHFGVVGLYDAANVTGAAYKGARTGEDGGFGSLGGRGMPFLAQQVVLQSMRDPPQSYRRALMFQRRSILACTHVF